MQTDLCDVKCYRKQTEGNEKYSPPILKYPFELFLCLLPAITEMPVYGRSYIILVFYF